MSMALSFLSCRACLLFKSLLPLVPLLNIPSRSCLQLDQASGFQVLEASKIGWLHSIGLLT